AVKILNPSNDNSDLANPQFSDSSSNSSIALSDSLASDYTVDSLLSILVTSESSFTALPALSQHLLAFENTIAILVDEVKKSHYLSTCKRALCAPQLQLLEEWCLNNDLKKFHCKLHVDPNIFTHLVNKITDHLW
ncbi:hypothetical protein V8B97DRAFT_1876234, partial [Scleroderma yunnanense]